MVFVSFSKVSSTIEMIICSLQQKAVQYIHIDDLLLLGSQDGPFEQSGLPPVQALIYKCFVTFKVLKVKVKLQHHQTSRFRYGKFRAHKKPKNCLVHSKPVVCSTSLSDVDVLRERDREIDHDFS